MTPFKGYEGNVYVLESCMAVNAIALLIAEKKDLCPCQPIPLSSYSLSTIY